MGNGFSLFIAGLLVTSDLVITITQRTDFALFEPRWTAGEDLKLLNAIFDCGHGNWSVAITY